ncbi:uncharacterized protein [Phyllobates terribilis]|uniref:uncharacterized protein isoform X2 n=1 Tax=Phyllobates terribilis TaxID=111132 RepID=UPI003CCAAF04
MVHTLCYYGCRQHLSAEDWRQRARSMDCTVPSSVIIPAVAARLKYYLDVERKEAGFDLSVNEKDSNEKHRLYQFAERHKRSPRLKENLLGNKLEASIRSYTRKSGWNKKVEINPDHQQQVRRRIRENMSSFTIPEHFARNYVFLRDINWKDSDWTVHSSGTGQSSRQAVSHGEFKRLISSAANLIVATTSEHHSHHLHLHKSIASEEPSPNTKTSYLDEDGQNGNLDLLKNRTVPTTSENIDYEIAVYTTVNVQETTPSMFIRLYGKSERTHTVSLQNPLAKTITSSAEQAFTFHVKAKDVGEVTDLSIRINKKDKARIWYCKKLIVKKGTNKYVFPYDDWLSPCRTMKAADMPATTRAQTAMDRDAKNVQMEKDKCRTTTTKPESRKNSSCLVSLGNLEFPCTSDGKVETAKKVNNSDLDSSNISINKSNQSPRTAEGNPSAKTKTMMRRYGPARRPQGNPSSKNAKVFVSSGKIKANKTSYHVPSIVVNPSTIIKSEDSKGQPLFGENSMDDVTSGNISTDGDLTMQNKIQSPKYRRASSPASYVFFALENKESSIILEVDGCTKKCTQDGPTSAKSRIIRRLSSGCANTRSQCSGENKGYISFDKGSSELALLQEILSDSGNNVTSGSFDSWPFSSCDSSQETRVQHGEHDDIIEVHGDFADYNKLGSTLDCEVTMTTGYRCSCVEHSSYETDSSLDEEYIFSDTSFDLSLSEDDTDSSSKFDALGEGQEEHNVDVMKQSKYQIRRQRRVESCSENSNIFQRSLAAIRDQDDATLRILCQSFFFLPSVTDEGGKTLLHHAAAQENPSICQVLLDTNIGLVNIDQQDKCGKTALHYAVQKDNPKTIKILLDNGAKVEIPDKRSKTVLDVALLKIQAK